MKQPKIKLRVIIYWRDPEKREYSVYYCEDVDLKNDVLYLIRISDKETTLMYHFTDIEHLVIEEVKK